MAPELPAEPVQSTATDGRRTVVRRAVLGVVLLAVMQRQRHRSVYSPVEKRSRCSLNDRAKRHRVAPAALLVHKQEWRAV